MVRKLGGGASVAALLLAGTALAPAPEVPGGTPGVSSLAVGSCTAAPSDSTAGLPMDALHREAMETTRNAPGASGTLHLAYAPSPFGLAVAADGRPVYRIGLELSGLRLPESRTAFAWAATPELDRVVRLGPVPGNGIVTGRVDWSRFLVFVTAESGTVGDRWSGPVLLVGRAPSSRMHTMRGHGIFEAHGIGC